ncbi:MAG: transketolase [Planctomycetes bacterium]|nr:transketolase [Planctomycetota bacterium]
MTTLQQTLDELCVNTIRTLAIDGVQHANSGHPGLPMGAAPMAYALWRNHLLHDPAAPSWPNRDRFVLSAGHGSMLLYALLHLHGYDVTLDDLKSFRQWHSRTPGHPESFATAGVEATTGPLGQGAANSVGMALAERMLAAHFNRPGFDIVDHHTYALLGDGCMMEGIVAEAASLAGQHRLGKLIWLYDSNDITLDGPTSLAFDVEDVAARFRAHGWHIHKVEDGDRDLAGLERAVAAAKAVHDKPSLIVVKTTIGYGAPHRQGTSEAHGSPLGPEEVAAAKKAFGFDPAQSFHVSPSVRAHFKLGAQRGVDAHAQWKRLFETYRAAHRELASEFERRMCGELPADFAVRCASELPQWEPGSGAATRDAGGKAQNALAAIVPELIGGDADLSCSTKTSLTKEVAFSAEQPSGRNLHFGVREHAMGAIGNGMLYHGGVRPFVSTFFVFSDYMRPAVRLAALCKLPLIMVWTHDSVAVGEDGPTHQPIEHLASLRAMPNLRVVRPGDPNETAQAWRLALESDTAPVALVLSRQKLPTLLGTKEKAREGVARGAYVLVESQAAAPSVLLIATGSELQLAVEAHKRLSGEGLAARVVSMPCWATFAAQERSYRDSVLPPNVRARVSVEAGTTFGWERWIGDCGVALGIDQFGASAPGEKVLAEYGFTVEKVVEAARRALANAAVRGA